MAQKTTIYSKLMQVQRKLRVPKDKINDFGGFKYRSLESILESLKPILSEVGASLVISDSVEMHGERIYIKATVAFIDADNGERIENTALAREAASKTKFDDAQLTGAASSYARKYALNGLFAIDDTRDPDALNVTAEYTAKPVKLTVTPPGVPTATEESVALAMQEVEAARSSKTVIDIWNSNKALQTNAKFKKAVHDKGTALKEQGK